MKQTHKFKKLLSWSFILYFIILFSVYFFQDKILFRPEKLSEDYVYQFNHSFKEIFLKTDDGEQLNAIHFTNNNPKGVILYFHGNKGSLKRWGKIAVFFAKKKYDVVIMDYRSYGKSTGEIKEEYLYQDAQLFYNYVLKFYNQDQIIVYGRSIGTGIAIKIASTNQPNKLILETPYYNLEDVANHWLPIFPVKSLMKFKIPSNEFIKEVVCEITIYHGTDDGVVPYKSGKKLYESISLQNKKMITIEGGGHNDLIQFNQYLNTIGDVLKK